MPLIREPQCPFCGHELPLRALWAFARMEDSRVAPAWSFLNSESGLLKGKIGVACPQCRTKFKVVQTRIRIFRVLTWALLFAFAAWWGQWSRRGNWVLDHTFLIVLIISALCAVALLNRYLTPYLAQVHPAGEEEDQLSYPLQSTYDGPSTSRADN